VKQTVVYLLMIISVLALPCAAYAGDGVTVVFKSGVIVTLNNGYKQLVDGMKELRTKGSQNFPVEILIEGNSFFVNLGEVVVLCRDSCSSLTLVAPKPQGR
jgi:X-X-X-Leu-X-X-Gly heptad repeat protein